MTACCAKCHRGTGIQDAGLITTNDGVRALEGVCPQCGSKMFAIPRDQWTPEIDNCEPFNEERIPYYSGIGRVLDTGYRYKQGETYDEDADDGYCTGQWIDVCVICGAIHTGNQIYNEGDIIRGIWSYGGDTCTVGKPQRGDIVGCYEGSYSQVWERINTGP